MGESPRTDNPRIDELRRRVLADPASIAFAALAEEYRRVGRYDEAIETCLGGLKRHPSYLSAHVTLGRALIEVGRYDEAEQELQFVLRTAPENLAAIRGMAEIHNRRGDTDHGAPAPGAAPPAAPDPQVPATDAPWTFVPPPPEPAPINQFVEPDPLPTPRLEIPFAEPAPPPALIPFRVVDPAPPGGEAQPPEPPSPDVETPQPFAIRAEEQTPVPDAAPLAALEDFLAAIRAARR